jgi:hypothetical protein
MQMYFLNKDYFAFVGEAPAQPPETTWDKIMNFLRYFDYYGGNNRDSIQLFSLIESALESHVKGMIAKAFTEYRSQIAAATDAVPAAEQPLTSNQPPHDGGLAAPADQAFTLALPQQPSGLPVLAIDLAAAPGDLADGDQAAAHADLAAHIAQLDAQPAQAVLPPDAPQTDLGPVAAPAPIAADAGNDVAVVGDALVAAADAQVVGDGAVPALDDVPSVVTNAHAPADGAVPAGPDAVVLPLRININPTGRGAGGQLSRSAPASPIAAAGGSHGSAGGMPEAAVTPVSTASFFPDNTPAQTEIPSPADAARSESACRMAVVDPLFGQGGVMPQILTFDVEDATKGEELGADGLLRRMAYRGSGFLAVDVLIRGSFIGLLDPAVWAVVLLCAVSVPATAAVKKYFPGAN